MKSSIPSKGDLPPLPPSASSTPSKFSDHEATVRNMPGEPVVPKNGPIQREPLDEYEDYDEQYEDAYSSHSQILQEGRGQAPLEDELPDTTMLDSVILPAIASVSIYGFSAFCVPS
jgi:serine/threonine-protein kinase 24/25/MST4